MNDIFNKLTEKCVPYRNFLTRTKHYVGRTRSFLDYYLLTPARPTYMCQMFLATCPQQVSVTPHATDQLRIQERQFPARWLHRTAFTTQFKFVVFKDLQLNGSPDFFSKIKITKIILNCTSLDYHN